MHNRLAIDVNALVRDIRTVEAARLSLLSGTIKADANRMSSDLGANNTVNLFNDFRTTVKDMVTEYVWVKALKLPNSRAILTNTTIQSNLLSVNRDRQSVYVFVRYVAAHTSIHAPTPVAAPSSLTSIVFATGTIGGETQRILAAQDRNALQTYNPAAAKRDNSHYLDSLSRS